MENDIIIYLCSHDKHVMFLKFGYPNIEVPSIDAQLPIVTLDTQWRVLLNDLCLLVHKRDLRDKEDYLIRESETR